MKAPYVIMIVEGKIVTPLHFGCESAQHLIIDLLDELDVEYTALAPPNGDELPAQLEKVFRRSPDEERRAACWMRILMQHMPSRSVH